MYGGPETMDDGISSECSSSNAEDDMDTSSATTSVGTSGHSSSVGEHLHVGREESLMIYGLRFLLNLVLVASTAIAAYFIYRVTVSGERQQFRTHFHDNSLKLIDSFADSLEHKIAAIDNYAVVSATQGNNEDWPYVAVPGFEVSASSTRSMAGIGLLSVVPIIKQEQRAKWEVFSANTTSWIENGLQFEGSDRRLHHDAREQEANVANEIYRIDPGTLEAVRDEQPGPYFPIWQSTPVNSAEVNYNLASHGKLGEDLLEAKNSVSIVLGRVTDVSKEYDPLNFLYQPTGLDRGEPSDQVDYGNPVSMTFFPVFDHIQEPRTMVALLGAAVYWRDFLVGVLPPSAAPLTVVLQNECDQVFSFEVSGENGVQILGEGDAHENKYDAMEETLLVSSIADSERRPSQGGKLTYSGAVMNTEYCTFSLRVFPTSEMEDVFMTRKPAVNAIVVVSVFLMALFVFVLYDGVVVARQRKVNASALATAAVVNSLFPKSVQARLFGNSGMNGKNQGTKTLANALSPSILTKGGDKNPALPIADLLPLTTILFADICGFTAWASSREPHQVFELLERLYGSFDATARRMKVFKVETIGDCYMAATGVPEYQHDDAPRMIRFASKCLTGMQNLLRELEVSLGPDTGCLMLRVGVHSGPVTAGVLRGERARFQLFGDTVNTASRMESTGMGNRIQCSEATAQKLVTAGKERWLEKRKDVVEAKGKGAISTFWVQPISGSSSVADSTSRPDESQQLGVSVKRNKVRKLESAQLQRTINWIVVLLFRHLKKVVASRHNHKSIHFGERRGVSIRLDVPEAFTPSFRSPRPPRQEMKESLTRPKLAAHTRANPEEVSMDPRIVDQLRDYVSAIAAMYHKNAFHNIDHASHVTMSAEKLLNRIEASAAAQNSEDFAYCIVADPLTHFGVLFATLVHDVDHTGVSNDQLIKEGSRLASVYGNESVAEQNSVDLAWDLLMENDFKELRESIFATQVEHDRFRSLVVNAVVATDVFAKDLIKHRNDRWERAYHSSNYSFDETLDVGALKATIVIEHLIQASDVSHTMQHWYVYQKWNRKLFHETYLAYKEGRGNNPTDGWYKGELWFFDNYVLPLAHKLKECGVFGVSSAEYLDYATQNRREWAAKGEEIVQSYVASFEEM